MIHVLCKGYKNIKDKIHKALEQDTIHPVAQRYTNGLSRLFIMG